MTETSTDFHHAEKYLIDLLEDDCKLLASLLDDCLRMEIGNEQFHKVELLRGYASSATLLAQKNDPESAQFLTEKLMHLIHSMPLDETLPIARACGHYLNLTGIAEMHHRVRQSRTDGLGCRSFERVFAKLLSNGITPEKLFETVCQHTVEIVLTAHPTQIVRRSLQYKLAKIAALLDQKERRDLTLAERETVINEVIREVTGLWQTQEFRAKPPTPTDEARGGLNIVEQSLWIAVPSYIRTLNTALKNATGYELPVDVGVVRFGSWMGSDREGNPGVTATVTRHVAYLGRWIAADLYLRDIDALRFELSMSRCSDSLWTMAKRIAEKKAVDLLDVGWEGNHKISNSSVADTQRTVFFPGVVDGPSDMMTTPQEIPSMCTLERNDGKTSMPNGTDDQNGGEVDKTGTVALDTSTTGSSEVEAVSPRSAYMKLASKKGTATEGSHNKLDEVLNPIQTSSLHEGSQPYRLLLGDVRQKLVNTKRRMESLLINGHSEVNDYYETAEQFQRTLLAVYDSLKHSGAGIIADGKLLDVIRRVSCFRLSLMKMDIREEAAVHVEAMDEITDYLQLGHYSQWDEAKKIEFLTKELQTDRPLISRDTVFTTLSARTKELFESFLVAAELGPSYLSAYIVSRPTAPSDVLLVELFQREASFMLALNKGKRPNLQHVIRAVPMFETLEGMGAASDIMKKLFENPWYRQHIKSMHGNAQEVMLGYCESGKGTCRFTMTWAFYKCQEQLVSICKDHEVALTVLYGRGGCMGRGGGKPMWLAVQSQPPGAINGKLRLIEQGEMVQAKFGVSIVAEEQLETCASAVLLSTLLPSQVPRNEGWLELMESLTADSRAAYDEVVTLPKLDDYFHHVTPGMEVSQITLVDRHLKAEKEMHVIKAVPWTFGWTQTRHVFPSWLGFGEAVQAAVENGQLKQLQDMYKNWPQFHSIVDLFEMILAKVDMRIAAVYDDTLVEDPEEKAIGHTVQKSYELAVKGLLMVTAHERLCDHNPLLLRLLSLRSPFLDPINMLQVQILEKLRSNPSDRKLKEALMITINGVAAGMRNTG